MSRIRWPRVFGALSITAVCASAIGLFVGVAQETPAEQAQIQKAVHGRIAACQVYDRTSSALLGTDPNLPQAAQLAQVRDAYDRDGCSQLLWDSKVKP